MKTLRILATLFFLSAWAVSQSSSGGGGGVTVTGAVTAGHCVSFSSANVIQDAGGACGGTGSSPGGASTSFQYNSTGTFGGTTTTDLSYSAHTITLGSTGILNMSAASVTGGVVLPSGAGAAPTAAGVISYNTTTNLPVFGNGSGTLNYPSSITGVAHNFLTSFTTSTGLFTQAQPAFGDISGAVTNGQLQNSAITIAGTSVSLGGSTTSFPSPGVIGGTTPAAGFFTTGSFTGALTTNMTGGPFCVDETNGVLNATASDCGAGGGTGTVTHTVGSLAPVGAPVIANGGADIQSTQGGELDLAPITSGADACGPLNTALLAAQTASVATPTISMVGVAPNVKCTSNPFSGYTSVNGAEIDLGGGTITTDVPWALPYRMQIKGIHGAGSTIVASTLFHTNYPAILSNGSTDTICLTNGSTAVVAGTWNGSACAPGGTATFTSPYNAAALASPPSSLVGYALLISPVGVAPTAANTFAVGIVKTVTDSQHIVLEANTTGNLTHPGSSAGYQFAFVMPVVSNDMANAPGGQTYTNYEQFDDTGIFVGDGITSSHGLDAHIGLFNTYCQEGCWAKDMKVTDAGWAGMAIEANASNSGPYDGEYILSNKSFPTSTGIVQVIVREIGTFHGIKNSTLNMRNGTTESAVAGILATSYYQGSGGLPDYGAMHFDGNHIEVGSGGDCVLIGDTQNWPWATGGEGLNSAKFTSNSCVNAAQNAYHITATTGNFSSHNIVIEGGVTEGAAACILDDANSVTYTNCPPLWIGPTTLGPTIIDGSLTAQLGTVDFSAATHTASAQAGLTANIPATCTKTATHMDVYLATDATVGQNWYFCTATNTWTQQLNSGTSGANQALSNLSGVAVNSSLIPQADNGIDLGSALLRWRNEYLGGSLIWTTAGNVADTGLCRGAAGQVDVSSGGACAATGNLFANGFASGSATVPGTGEISLPGTAAPSAPASGTLIWFDSTDLRVHEIGNAATIGTTVVAKTATSHQFVTAISTAGVITQAQPAISDLTATFSSPLSLSVNTLSCSTCATTTNGGALTATSPVTISAAGLIAISGVTGEQGNGALLQLSTGTVNLNRITKFDTNGNTINSNLLEASSLMSNAANTATTYSGALDASANAAQASTTFRGGDETGAGGASSTGGPVLIRGGNNAATNTSSVAGSVLIEPGASTGATQGLQGLLFLADVYIKAATSTQWDLACENAAMAVNNCGASPTNWVGVIEAVNTNTNVVVSPPSLVPINASAAVTLGHTVCAGSTAGQVTDSGGTATCTNTQGAQVGVVMATSGTYTLGDGTTVTASTTLPLIKMNTAALASTGGGGSGTVSSCATIGALADYTGSTTVGCGNADFTYATHTLTSAATGILDLSAATGTAAFKVPSTTTNTATAAAVIDFDTTAGLYHGFFNGADHTFLYTSGPLGTPLSGTLTNATGLPINGVVSATGAIASIALGNNGLTFTSALAGSTDAVNITEATAGTGTGELLGLTTTANSTTVPFEITQGSTAPTAANPGTAAPKIEYILGEPGGNASSGTNPGGAAGYSLIDFEGPGTIAGNPYNLFPAREVEYSQTGGQVRIFDPVGSVGNGTGGAAQGRASKNPAFVLTNPTASISISGTVNTQNASTGGCTANCVTETSTANFTSGMVSGTVVINSVNYVVSQFVSSSLIGLSTAPGTQTGVALAFNKHQEMPPIMWNGSYYNTGAVNTFSVGATGAGGSGYSVGDLLMLNPTGCNAEWTVTTVSSGAVTGIALYVPPDTISLQYPNGIPYAGVNCTAGNNLATQSSTATGGASGTLATVNILTVGAPTLFRTKLENFPCTVSSLQPVYSTTAAADLNCTEINSDPSAGTTNGLSQWFGVGNTGGGVWTVGYAGGGGIQGIAGNFGVQSIGGQLILGGDSSAGEPANVFGSSTTASSGVVVESACLSSDNDPGSTSGLFTGLWCMLAINGDSGSIPEGSPLTLATTNFRVRGTTTTDTGVGVVLGVNVGGACATAGTSICEVATGGLMHTVNLVVDAGGCTKGQFLVVSALTNNDVACVTGQPANQDTIGIAAQNAAGGKVAAWIQIQRGCTKCATTTNGGALSGVAPMAISAGGAISLQNSTPANVTASLGTDTEIFTASGSAATTNDAIVGDSSGGIKDGGFTAAEGCSATCSYTLGYESIQASDSAGVVVSAANHPNVMRVFNPTSKVLGQTAIVNVTTLHAASHVDVGVYSISGTTLTRQWHTGSMSGAATGAVAATSLTTFTMLANTNYYLAYCTDDTTVVLDASIISAGAAASTRSTILGSSSAPANTYGQDATDTCTAGVLPSTMTSTNITNSTTNVQIPWTMVTVN